MNRPKQQVKLTGHLSGDYLMEKGFTQYEAPKTWQKLGVCGHNIGNNYNPSTLTVWQARDKRLKYEIYRDGNFYSYFGNLIEEVK